MDSQISSPVASPGKVYVSTMLPLALSGSLHLQQAILRLPRVSPRLMAHLARSPHVELHRFALRERR